MKALFPLLVLPAVLAIPPLSAQGQSSFTQPSRSIPMVPISDQLQALEKRWRSVCSDLDGKQKISLQEALRLGLTNNPILSQNYAEIAASQSSTTAIRREWYPSLFFTQPNNAPWDLAIGTQTNNQSGSNSATTHQTLQQLYSSPRLTMQWSFLDPTRTPRLKSQLLEYRSKQLLFDISTRNLVLDIQQSYYALQEASELRNLYGEIYQLTKDQLTRAERMRPEVIDTSGEISQLKTQLLQQLIEVIQIFQQELIAANSLARVLSLAPGELRLPSDPLKPVDPWTPSLQSTISNALLTREEIQNNLANSSSLSWSSKALAQSYLPSMALMGQSQLTTNNQSQTSSGSESSSGSSNNQTFSNSVGLKFNWLIVDGGVVASQATSLSQRAQAADYQAADTRYLVTQQVQDSYANYITTRMVIDTALQQLRTAKQAVLLTSRNYNGTSVNATTFNQTIRNFLSAAKSFKASVRGFNIAVASLFRYSSSLPPSVQDSLDKAKMNLISP
ncbi:TolC family protein [Cyanobium sp. WAJ14-Wanaka]|uniref:TolC family protein n=1 Tax=Cyanobium sp. WAJ14-Wanaka TaxID=2823725 RepID=UPI0020CB968F|nr:TolC family protein [Cyanobium sp. WAJ14-Wanaka]MCP9775904.1 TolC family protein [Cyanobium sp. WAJ14-Wanaka]